MSLPKSVLITGASSGLGEALALSYAAPDMTLFLSGRDQARLDEVAGRCRTKGARVEVTLMDVADPAAMEQWVLQADTTCPIDLVIANAGVSAGTAGSENAADQTRRIFRINIDGVANTILPLIPRMQARRKGHIAIMSSLASFMGLAGAPAYSASKACVRTWGEGLRGWLAADNVTVSVICPGFVTTRMTAANDFPMPFVMDSAKAAKIMRAGLDKGKARIAYPTVFYLLIVMSAALPIRLRDWWNGRLPRKE